jgi:hypothetical protein
MLPHVFMTGGSGIFGVLDFSRILLRFFFNAYLAFLQCVLDWS